MWELFSYLQYAVICNLILQCCANLQNVGILSIHPVWSQMDTSRVNQKTSQAQMNYSHPSCPSEHGEYATFHARPLHKIAKHNCTTALIVYMTDHSQRNNFEDGVLLFQTIWETVHLFGIFPLVWSGFITSYRVHQYCTCCCFRSNSSCPSTCATPSFWTIHSIIPTVGFCCVNVSYSVNNGDTILYHNIIQIVGYAV